MVGVPRSSGCSLCRKRRVKCDEDRPACGNCLKYGVKCPGYERGMKFITGKHHIRQRGRLDCEHGSVSVRDTKSRARVEASTTLTVVSPSPNRGQFISTILEQLRPSVSQYDVVGLFAWIQLERLGQKALLDAAMCSLTLHLFGKEYSDETMLAHSRTMYGQSLRALQAVLRHPSEWRSSETLCSTILLCVFELFEGTSSDAWLQHARGIGTLMEQRGPAAHAEGWDAAMMLAFRGVLIMSDMFFPTGVQCFLARPEWRAVTRDGGRYLVHPSYTTSKIIELSDRFFEYLADMPAVLRWGYRLREANTTGFIVEPAKIVALAGLASNYHSRFGQWNEDFQALSLGPTEALSKDPESLYPSVLSYEHPWAGSMHMAYWASMLILEETLVQCRWPTSFEESQKELVNNILRSVECVGSGTMGPYRVGYALRVAYEFASAEAQHWIRSILDRFHKTYAATDKATYPSPRIDEGGYA